VGVVGASLASGDLNCPTGGSAFTSAAGVVTYACSGAVGATGATGPQGPSGPAGANGAAGAQGPQGNSIRATPDDGTGCGAAGGQHLTAIDSNGVAVPGSVQYVCNGTGGFATTGYVEQPNPPFGVQNTSDWTDLPGMIINLTVSRPGILDLLAVGSVRTFWNRGCALRFLIDDATAFPGALIQTENNLSSIPGAFTTYYVPTTAMVEQPVSAGSHTVKLQVFGNGFCSFGDYVPFRLRATVL
jgi:hypothetical protein